MDGRHIGTVLPVSILTYYSHRQVILHQPVDFRRNWTILGEVMTSYRFFKMAAIESEIYFRVLFHDGTRLERWKSTGIPNFDDIF